MFQIGDRVEMIDGVEEGERGTVVYHEGEETHESRGMVCVQFDNQHMGWQWVTLDRVRLVR